MEEYGPTIRCGLVPELTEVAVLCHERQELAGVGAEQAHHYIRSKKEEELPSSKKTMGEHWVLRHQHMGDRNDVV